MHANLFMFYLLCAHLSHTLSPTCINYSLMVPMYLLKFIKIKRRLIISSSLPWFHTLLSSCAHVYHV
uniref:Uncharacterized protein n=1 Tax=Arundo donax TaxID=35708 RepID=A0A0A9DZL3_ARUDO